MKLKRFFAPGAGHKSCLAALVVSCAGLAMAATYTTSNSSGIPTARTATFADDVAGPNLEAAHLAQNFRISNLPEFTSAYPVRLVHYWDKKSNATIFDVEIGGARTMICRRAGKFKEASGK
ncbi:MAG: hypothetical protein IJ658_10155 [Kiritimatiellae bacterium]|nr:hypothetical protein [Kiritimatiellia bacterium]